MEKPTLAAPFYQGIPLSPDDNIIIRGLSSTILMDLIIQGTCIDQRGKIVNFNEVLNLTAIGTLFTGSFRLGYQFLLSLTITTTTSLVPDGSCYVQAAIINPIVSTPIQYRKILAQGYVSTYQGISYGSNNPNPATSDPWYILNLPVSAPAAGANITYNCSSYLLIEINALSFTLTTSGTVASRIPDLEIVNPNANTLFLYCGFIQTALQVRKYNFRAQIETTISHLPNISCEFPLTRLAISHVLRTNTIGLQVDDQFSNIAIFGRGKTLPI